MLVNYYLKRNYVKDYDLRFTYLRFIFDVILKSAINQDLIFESDK